MLEVRVDNLPDVTATMDRVQAAIREPKLPKVWKALAADLRTYPPPPPGSKYVRTGHLARSWRITFGQGRQATLFSAVNDADYSLFVQGDAKDQAAVHRGRWTPANEILAKREREITEEWELQIERAAR